MRLWLCTPSGLFSSCCTAEVPGEVFVLRAGFTRLVLAVLSRDEGLLPAVLCSSGWLGNVCFYSCFQAILRAFQLHPLFLKGGTILHNQRTFVLFAAW